MDDRPPARLDKTAFSVATLTDPPDERAYWHRQTPQARLEALELLRQAIYGYDPVSDRLQRVLTVHRVKLL